MDLYIFPKDTTLEAARIRFSILRKIGPEGRAQMTIELSDGLRTIIESGVRQRHPEYDEKTVRMAVLRITIGKELFQQLYPGVKVNP